MLVIAMPLGIVAALRRGRLADLVRQPRLLCRRLAAGIRHRDPVVLVLADWLQLLPATGYVPLDRESLATACAIWCCRC